MSTNGSHRDGAAISNSGAGLPVAKAEQTQRDSFYGEQSAATWQEISNETHDHSLPGNMGSFQARKLGLAIWPVDFLMAKIAEEE